jgi:protein SCO1/2
VKRLVFFLLLCAPAWAQGPGSPRVAGPDSGGDILREVRFDQNLGAQVPLDLQLIGEAAPFHRKGGGKSETLRDLLGGKPAILDLGYYECPMLCHQVQSGLVDSLKLMKWTVGQQFRVLTISIDPRERPDLARRQKDLTVSRYDRPLDPLGWRFLTGTPTELVTLTQAVGFRAIYDRRIQQFAHPAGLVILTPQGVVSSYLYGISFSARALQRGLEKAASAQVGTPVDPVLFLCYHYDPATGRYSLEILKVIRLFGISFALLLFGAVGMWVYRERKSS